MTNNGRKRFKRIGQGLVFGLKEFGKIGQEVAIDTRAEIKRLQKESRRQQRRMLTPGEKLIILQKRQRLTSKQIRRQRKEIVKGRLGGLF